MYPTVDTVRIENRFAPVAFRLPVSEGEETLRKVCKETSKLKTTFPMIYFMFVLGRSMSWIVPDFISKRTADSLS